MVTWSSHTSKSLLPEDLQMLSSRLVFAQTLPVSVVRGGSFFSHWCKWSGNRLGCSLFINKALHTHKGRARLDDTGRPELPGETCCACRETEQAHTPTSTNTVVHINVVLDCAFACPLMSDKLSHSILAASTRGPGGILSVMGSHLLTKTKGRTSHVAFSSKTHLVLLHTICDMNSIVPRVVLIPTRSLLP
jgi:hypothetical protein